MSLRDEIQMEYATYKTYVCTTHGVRLDLCRGRVCVWVRDEVRFEVKR